MHEERERISREIHDTLAQGFTSVVALSRAAQAALARGDVAAARERLALIEHTASDNLDEARLIVAELTPGHLQSRTLGEALERLGAAVTSETGMRADVRVAGEPGAARRVGRGRHPAHRPGGAVQRAAPRVAPPGSTSPWPTTTPTRWCSTVRDDGLGFDLDGARSGFGLDGVQARAAEVGGAVRGAQRAGHRHDAAAGGAAVIRLLVVDDHPVVRAGMVAVLGEESDFEVVGEAANGAEALGLVPRLRPDVVLMDLRMPVMDGAEATARITAEPDAPHVLVLTTYDTDADIVRAVEAGARGYLLKDAPTGVLADAIRRAARGETVLAPPVAARLADRLRAPARPELTARELEVLGLVARGLSNADIGRELFIGEATVKTHLIRAFAKLGVTDRTAAVTAAYGSGLHRAAPPLTRRECRRGAGGRPALARRRAVGPVPGPRRRPRRPPRRGPGLAERCLRYS